MALRFEKRLFRDRGADSSGSAQSLDLRFLHEAAQSLLGYFVFNWFNQYLGVIFANIRRYVDGGFMSALAEPTEAGRYRMLFDFSAIDLEKLVYVNGIYAYVLSAHKGANRHLMNPYAGKQVLYLRGYDYEGAVSAGHGAALGYSSMDTMQFTEQLGEWFPPHQPDVAVFRVLSPKDVYWGTVGAQRHFYTDFAGVIAAAQYPMYSVYLNAARWQEGVTALLDRMDHYVVYVSSITDSLLWELDQLDRADRRGRVTVIFDGAAIGNKETQLDTRDAMHRLFPRRVTWAKETMRPSSTEAERLRAHLESRFLVTTPKGFESDLQTHRRRIAHDAAPLALRPRTTSVDFDFRPALDPAKLRQLEAFSAELQRHVDQWTGPRGIDSLPIFLNLVQLRIFCTLLMGEHRDTGRALASYAAVMSGAHDYYAAPDVTVGALSAKRREEHLAMLRSHLDQAAGIGWSLLSYGRSDEFGDYRRSATADYDSAFARTKSAVSDFFSTAVRLNRGLR